MAGLLLTSNRHRKADNAAGSNMVVIDIDGDTTLARFWQTDTARRWCAAATPAPVTLKKSTASVPCFHWAKSATTAEHRGAYWLIVNRLLAELELTELATIADRSLKDYGMAIQTQKLIATVKMSLSQHSCLKILLTKKLLTSRTLRHRH